LSILRFWVLWFSDSIGRAIFICQHKKAIFSRDKLLAELVFFPSMQVDPVFVSYPSSFCRTFKVGTSVVTVRTNDERMSSEHFLGGESMCVFMFGSYTKFERLSIPSRHMRTSRSIVETMTMTVLLNLVPLVVMSSRLHQLLENTQMT
jgi:hypothetical protein